MPITLIDKIKQKNNGTFKLVDAVDIAWDDSTSLVDKINQIVAGENVDLSSYLKTADADAKYVAKVDGKGLSTNDYTTEEKTKLAGLYTSGTTIFANTDVLSNTDVLVSDLVLPTGYTAHVGDTIIDTHYDAYYVTSVGQNSDKKDIVHVSNALITNPLASLQSKLTFDDTPTRGSANPVTSGGIAAAIEKVTYTLPAATDSVLGGVTVGANITNTNGAISVSKDNIVAALGYTPADAANITIESISDAEIDALFTDNTDTTKTA